MTFPSIWFKRRPQINSFPENTGVEAYQPYNGLALVDYQGITGQTVLRNFNALNPGMIVPGPSHKVNDPTVTGNVNYGLTTVPLSQPDITKLTQL